MRVHISELVITEDNLPVIQREDVESLLDALFEETKIIFPSFESKPGVLYVQHITLDPLEDNDV